MCFRIQAEQTPKLDEYYIPDIDLNRLVLSEYPNIHSLFLWDSYYYYVSHEDWGKVIRDCMMNLPNYQAEKFDCENFALRFNSKVSERYRLNTMGVAIGASPMGYHGYNVFISENMTLSILESQTGVVYSTDEDSGYIPEIIIFG